MAATYIVWAYLDEDKGRYMRLYSGPGRRHLDPLVELRTPEGLKIDEDGTPLAMTLTPIGDI